MRNCYTRTSKVIVFDKQLGKIEAITFKGQQSRCIQGGFIQYRAEERGRTYILHDLELLEIPALWVSTDIAFLHHILELAQYFMQPLQASKELFDFFGTIYKARNDLDMLCSSKILLVKKLFLCKLFVHLGMYPQLNNKQDEILFSLISSSTDIMLNDYDASLDKKMSGWLYDCLQTHIGTTHLKTLDFLVKVTADEISNSTR